MTRIYLANFIGKEIDWSGGADSSGIKSICDEETHDAPTERSPGAELNTNKSVDSLKSKIENLLVLFL